MASLQFLSAAELHGRLAAGETLQIIDVRTPEEFAAGHLDGAVLAPHDQITAWPETLDPSQPTAVICKAGGRAVHAAAILDRLTDGELLVVAEGGVPDWPSLGGTLTPGT